MNIKNIGKRISEVQKKKNISIKEICCDFCSESTYFRIINGQVDPSFKILNHIINKLNVNYDEFFMMVDPKKKLKNDMSEIRNAFLNKNEKKLHILKKSIENENLEDLCDLLINRLNSNFEIQENRLILYLLKIESWTRYELILFNNCIFIFEYEIINTLIAKVLNDFFKNEEYYLNSEELFQLCVNVCVVFLQKGYVTSSYSIYKSILNMKLSEDKLYEKNLLLFLSGLFDIIKSKKYENNHKIDMSLLIFKELGSDRLHFMHNELLLYVKKNKICLS